MTQGVSSFSIFAPDNAQTLKALRDRLARNKTKSALGLQGGLPSIKAEGEASVFAFKLGLSAKAKEASAFSIHSDENAKTLEQLREGLARIETEGDERWREIKERKAAEAGQRLADAERQMDDLQRVAMLMKAAGDRKGLRELVRQATMLGKQVAEDLGAVGEGALALAGSDPASALKTLEKFRDVGLHIAAQLRGLAALARQEDEKETGKAAEDTAKEIDGAIKELPFAEVGKRLAEKTIETYQDKASEPIAMPDQGALSLIV